MTIARAIANKLRPIAAGGHRTQNQWRIRAYHALTRSTLVHLAFEYEPGIEYSMRPKLLSEFYMDNQCQYYQALIFKQKHPASWCNN